MFLTLILLPKIVGYIGQEKYGVFRVIAEWIGFTSVFTVALSSFSSQRIARTLNQSKELLHNEIRRIGWFAFGLGAFLFIAFGIFLLSTSNLLFASALVSDSEFAWAVFWGVASLLLLPSIPLQGYFEATQRGYQVNLVMFAQRLVILIGSWLAASITTSIAWQFFVIFVGVALTSLSFFAIANREISATSKERVNYSEAKSFAIQSFPFMTIDLAGRLGLSADTLLISYIIGNSSVTLFYLALRIPSLLTNQILGLGNAIWAGFLEFYRTKEREEVKNLFTFISKLSIALAALAAILIGLFNGPTMQLWLGNLVIDQKLFHMIVGLNIIPISLASLWGWLATALGHEKKFARISFESAIINIALGIALTYQLGFLGPVLGTLIGYGFYQTYRLYLLMSSLIELNVKNFFSLVTLPVATVLIFLLAGSWALREFAENPNWLGLFFYGAIATILYLFSLVLYFSNDEKLRLKKLITRT